MLPGFVEQLTIQVVIYCYSSKVHSEGSIHFAVFRPQHDVYPNCSLYIFQQVSPALTISLRTLQFSGFIQLLTIQGIIFWGSYPVNPQYNNKKVHSKWTINFAVISQQHDVNPNGHLHLFIYFSFAFTITEKTFMFTQFSNCGPCRWFYSANLLCVHQQGI